MRAAAASFVTYTMLIGNIGAAIYLFSHDEGSGVVQFLVVLGGVLWLLRACGFRFVGQARTVRGPLLGPVVRVRPRYDIFFLPALVISATAFFLYFLS